MSRDGNAAGRGLRALLQRSRSYESRAGFGAEGLKTELVGIVRDGDRLRYVYEDEAGNFWNKTKYETERGVVSEYEKIFGHPEPKRGAGRRRARAWR